ncbi:MAG: type II toxin-antitoxin system VapC family toxin [Nanoarchaeota archaeon]|nr:type II toxin-antitoxin system VapC family toxin [Nanoarchaeota archaeon]
MVEKICLDSDVIINFLRKDPRTKTSLEKLGRNFYTTPINVFEIWSGRISGEEEKIRDVLDSLDKNNFDEKAAIKAAEMNTELASTGNVLDFRDIFIASICITNNLCLLTENKKHFERMKKFGLKLI